MIIGEERRWPVNVLNTEKLKSVVGLIVVGGSAYGTSLLGRWIGYSLLTIDLAIDVAMDGTIICRWSEGFAHAIPIEITINLEVPRVVLRGWGGRVDLYSYRSSNKRESVEHQADAYRLLFGNYCRTAIHAHICTSKTLITKRILNGLGGVSWLKLKRLSHQERWNSVSSCITSPLPPLHNTALTTGIHQSTHRQLRQQPPLASILSVLVLSVTRHVCRPHSAVSSATSHCAARCHVVASVRRRVGPRPPHPSYITTLRLRLLQLANIDHIFILFHSVQYGFLLFKSTICRKESVVRR